MTGGDTFSQHFGYRAEEAPISVREDAPEALRFGSEAFAQALSTASEVMQATGRVTAAGEMHEALKDISRRPPADVTGAIQHAMASLECVARGVTAEPNKTLGQLIAKLGSPRPLDSALEKLWGFASEQGGAFGKAASRASRRRSWS